VKETRVFFPTHPFLPLGISGFVGFTGISPSHNI
jgi:hypothetical protein